MPARAHLPRMDSSVDGEAVEQAVPACALEVLLAATARPVCRVPGRGVLAPALAIVVAHLGAPLAVLGPVAAGVVLAGWERRAIQLRASDDVVHVGRVAAPVHHGALLGERVLL